MLNDSIKINFTRKTNRLRSTMKSHVCVSEYLFPRECLRLTRSSAEKGEKHKSRIDELPIFTGEVYVPLLENHTRFIRGNGIDLQMIRSAFYL